MHKQTALYIRNCLTKSPYHKDWHADTAAARSHVTLQQVQLNSSAVLEKQLFGLCCNINSFRQHDYFLQLKEQIINNNYTNLGPSRPDKLGKLSILTQTTEKIANCSVVWFLMAICLSELMGQ